jgi:hypothetical protein
MLPVTLHCDKLYKGNLDFEYAQAALPFERGDMKKENLCRLELSDGERSYPLQTLPTAFWPDGSIRFLLVRFLGFFPGNKKKVIVLDYKGARLPLPAGEVPVLSVRKEEKGFAVSTGPLEARLENGTEAVFASLTAKGRSYGRDQFAGPVLVLEGREYLPLIERWTVVEEGPVMAILEGQGSYRKVFGEAPTRVTVRLTFTAGKPWIDMAARLFNDSMGDLVPDAWRFHILPDEGMEPLVRLQGMEGEGKPDSTGCGDLAGTMETEDLFMTSGTGELPCIEEKIRREEGYFRTLSGISNYKTRFSISGRGKEVSLKVGAKDLVAEANEHFAEVLYGTFMADFCDRNGGVCATVYQAQQNFPKAIAAGKNGLSVFLIPEGEEKVVFSSGMAREQRMLLHFHTGEESIEELDNRSLIYQMPVQPWVDPEHFDRAGFMPGIVTDPAKADPETELLFMDMADNHGRAYGMMNWGDFPDSNYTAQGRGGGKLVWTNNEYDFPHAMFALYARTGVRRFLDYARTAALHWMDVDICHYSTDPLRQDGQWEHTRSHNGGSEDGKGPGGVMVCSHEWVEGLLDLWHFTGDRRALESALGIGENVLRLLETPMYLKPGEASARETGWALRTLTALYLETGEDKWLAKSRFIISQFREWNDRYGTWLAPYTDNTVIRVGFMISVAAGSLMRIYRVFPDPDLKDLILGAIDDLTENFMNPYGLFYYKELPSLMRNGNNTLLLEAMAIGYELTGFRHYLDCGIRTFRLQASRKPGLSMTKRIAEDAVLVGSAPTKSFAQAFLPMVTYYNALLKEGMDPGIRY